MSTVRFQIHDDAIKRTLGPNSYFVQQYLPRVGNQIVNGAKRRANVKTGLMRSRIEFRLDLTRNPVGGIVAAKTRYARYVHDGTRYYAGSHFLTEAAREVLGR